jgi:glycosyltransferase involved in cell wall biosynthesis
VLDQTYGNLEILVYDDASTDDTERVCRSYAAREPRMRYLRRDANIGLTANFNALYSDASGKYVLALSDDDWFDHDYVAACVRELEKRPDHTIVGGLSRYYASGDYAWTGTDRTLQQDSPSSRVIAYCKVGGDTGSAYYGVMRNTALKAALPMQDVPGQDWLLVAALALQGKVLTIRDVSVHRELGGISAYLPSLVRHVGGGAVAARMGELTISLELARDIMWRCPVYRRLGRPRRAVLAITASFVRTDWTAQAWYVAELGAGVLRRWRATRWLARLFDSATESMLNRRHARRAASGAAPVPVRGPVEGSSGTTRRA